VVVRALDAAAITVDDITLRRPTLDEVFMALTGRTASAPATSERGTSKNVKERAA
jgi:ABC-2 type transport system ATP-binding protein